MKYDGMAVGIQGVRLSLGLIALGFGGIFVIAVAAGYLMGQTSFRTTPPPRVLTMPVGPSISPPGAPGAAPSPAPDAGAVPSGSPPGLEAQPAPSPAAPVAPGASPEPAPPAGIVPAQPGGQAGPSVTPPIPEPPSRFHVQAGVFDDRVLAEVLVRQLRNRGYAVAIIEGPPYRVWVGGYFDRATAERLAGNLRSAGFDATLTAR